MNKMKNFTLTIAGFCFYFIASSQDPGIHFEKGLNWPAIQAKAKKEHKFIFVDCYTTWCGPCKYMAKNIFPLKEAGDAVNQNFICVTVQLDSSKNDSDTTKGWYADAHMIAMKYNVNAYPTYLFFNPKGKLVHRAVGATRDAGQFISYTKDALNPDRQYYLIMDKYRKGNRDTTLLESLCQQAKANGDVLLADSVLKDWFGAVKDPFTKDRLDLIAQITKKSGDPGFDLFYHNAAKIDRIEKPDFAETVVMNIIIQQNQTIMGLFKDSTAVPDWDQISQEITTQYNADYAFRIVTWVKVPYYKMKKEYDIYGSSLVSYLKEFGDHLEGAQLNNYAWDIFEYCTKPEDLAFGISCSARTLTGDQKSNAGFIDTYANLLYKSGQKDEAIAQESKALDLIDAAQKPDYQATLDKMKSGVKTWD
jgi:thioredoxin-related protein